jgi:hypothetical protein
MTSVNVNTPVSYTSEQSKEERAIIEQVMNAQAPYTTGRRRPAPPREILTARV